MSVDHDVVIVGAGFAGILAMHKFRSLGLKVQGFERKSSIGGVWRENAYPGAAVDSQPPFYQFYDHQLLDGWDWTEAFPTRAEMGRYFDYVDQAWHVGMGFEFQVEVKSAHWHEEAERWELHLVRGTGREWMTSTRWLVPAVGFSSVLNIPQLRGIGSFRGEVYHTARWPEDGVDLDGKTAAVIGTGPSAVQVIQAVGQVADRLIVYQRHPPLTLPKYPKSPKDLARGGREAFQRSLNSFTGFDYSLRGQNTFEVSAEERTKHYTDLYHRGGWAFWMGAFQDLWYDRAANLEAYSFWATVTGNRVKDDLKRSLLIPSKPSRPFGVQRPCLEENLYEVLDQSNVDLVDISREPIEEITHTGIRAHGELRDVDVIILATGFGNETSGLVHLNLRGLDGSSLKDAWKHEVRSFLGLAVRNFPNMFYIYGPQCPTLLVNSPAVITVQVDWLCELLSDARRHGITRVEATREGESMWAEKLRGYWTRSLYCTTSHERTVCSEGHKEEMHKEEMTWVGGLSAYRQELDECSSQGLRGFDQR